MSQDTVSDGLNEIMNAKKVGKKELEIKKISKVLINLFKIMKKIGYIDYEILDKDENKKKPKVLVKILKLNFCKAIKPRYVVKAGEIEKYLRRFLVSRNFGVVIISTNNGLMTDEEAIKNKVGGSLIAYFY